MMFGPTCPDCGVEVIRIIEKTHLKPLVVGHGVATRIKEEVKYHCNECGSEKQLEIESSGWDRIIEWNNAIEAAANRIERMRSVEALPVTYVLDEIRKLKVK